MCKYLSRNRFVLTSTYTFPPPYSGTQQDTMLNCPRHDICSDVFNLFNIDNSRMKPSPLHYQTKNLKAILNKLYFLLPVILWYVEFEVDKYFLLIVFVICGSWNDDLFILSECYYSKSPSVCCIVVQRLSDELSF